MLIDSHITLDEISSFKHEQDDQHFNAKESHLHVLSAFWNPGFAEICNQTLLDKVLLILLRYIVQIIWSLSA